MSFPRPRGIEVAVTLPRWPFRLLLIGIGLLLLLMIAAVPFALLSGGDNDGASSMSMGVTAATLSGDRLRVTAQFEQEGADDALDANAWSLLLDDATTVGGVLVDGPSSIGGTGEGDIVVEFVVPAGREPRWVRFDTGIGHPFAFPLTLSD